MISDYEIEISLALPTLGLNKLLHQGTELWLTHVALQLNFSLLYLVILEVGLQLSDHFDVHN